LLILFVFICLCFYLHDRSILVSCASELAGKGAAEKYQTEEELERWLERQAKELAEERVLAVRELEVSAEVTGNLVTVGYAGKVHLLGGLEIREQETAKRINAVNFIRNSRRLGRVFKE